MISCLKNDNYHTFSSNFVKKTRSHLYITILPKLYPYIKAESTYSDAGEASPAAGLRGFNEPNSANRITAEGLNEDPLASREILVVYSKAGCCLCDGLKDKLQLILASPSNPILEEVMLEVNSTLYVSDFFQPLSSLHVMRWCELATDLSSLLICLCTKQMSSG